MSPLFTFVLVVHVILALALVVLVLLQRSEGGVLGIGGSSSGLMTARGASDLLTTATRWLATAFVITSIGLAAIAARDRKATGLADDAVKASTVQKKAPATSGVPEVPVPNMEIPSLQLPLESGTPARTDSAPASVTTPEPAKK
jgi:preprotein translocase subunit SecG